MKDKRRKGKRSTRLRQATAWQALNSERIETRSLPTLTHVLPPISTSRFAHLCRSRPRGSVHSLLPSQLYVDRSHCPRPHASYLAALPSIRAISQKPVFYVAHPIRSIRELCVIR